jgi:hypothetical protein
MLFARHQTSFAHCHGELRLWFQQKRSGDFDGHVVPVFQDGGAVLSRSTTRQAGTFTKLFVEFFHFFF